MAILDLFKGRDGVYRQDVSVDEQIEAYRAGRSFADAYQRQTSLKDVPISEAEKCQTAFYDSMSMSSD